MSCQQVFLLFTVFTGHCYSQYSENINEQKCFLQAIKNFKKKGFTFL